MGLLGGFLTGVYVLLAAINIEAAYNRKRMPFFLTKSILMLVLMAVYAANSSSLLLSVVIALFSAWAGDMLLLYRRHASLAWGGLAFIICHSFYIWTFWSIGYPHDQWQVYILVASLYVFIGILFYIRFIGSFYELPDFLEFGIGLYLIVILLMSFSGLLILRANNIYSFFPFAGSLLFIFSDYLLAVGSIIKNTGIYYPWAIASYFTAQLLIVEGLILLGF